MSVDPSTTPPPSAVKPTRYRSLGWLKNILRFTLYLPLLLLVICAVLIGTPIGSRIAVNLADALIPNLSLNYQSGTLNKQVSLSSAHWQTFGIDVHVGNLQLNWQPLCLLQRQLCVKNLTATKITVDIDTHQITQQAKKTTAADNPVRKKNQRLTLPIAITLTNTNLNDIKVAVNDMHFNARHIQGQASWLATGLRVNELNSEGLLVDIPLSGDDKGRKKGVTAAPLKSTNGIDKKKSWPLAKLPQVAIPMPIFVDKLKLIDSNLRLGKRQDNFSFIQLQGSYVDYDITVRQLIANHDYAKLNLNGRIGLKKHYPMNINLNALTTKPKELPLLNKQRIKLHAKGDFSKLTLVSSGNGDVNFKLAGHIDLTKPSLPYQLDLDSDHLMWPLQKPSYQVHQLSLQSKGNFGQQELTFSGKIDTPYYPALNVKTHLFNKDEKVDIKQLDVDGDTAKFSLTGGLYYKDGIGWDVALVTDKLQLAPLILPTKTTLPDTLISGSLNSQGKVKGKQWQVGIKNSNLTGEIDNYPFKLQGDVNINNNYQLNAKALLIEAVDSKLALSGYVNDNWAIKGSLSVPALSSLSKDISGAIETKIDVSGEKDNPKVTLNAITDAIKYHNINIDQAKLNAIYYPQDNHRFKLSLTGSDIKTTTGMLSSITLNANGDKTVQNLNLLTDGDIRVDTAVTSTTNFDTQQFNAKVERLNLDSTIGPLALNHSVNIDWNNQHKKGSLQPFCWQHQQGKLCLKNTAPLGESGNATVQFEGDIGKLLTPILPEGIRWQGAAKLVSHTNWSANSRPQMKLSLLMTDGSLSLPNQQDKIKAGYRHLKLLANLDNDKLAINTQFETNQSATINSQINIGVRPSHPLSGFINLQNIRLLPLANFIPTIESVDGTLSTSITLAGNLKKPRLSGVTELKGGQLSMTASPTRVDNVNLKLKFNGPKALLNGNLTMGGGHATVAGKINWIHNKFNGFIKFNGKKLAIIQPPLIALKVSPDIIVSLDRRHVDISGRIYIPSGDIKIVQLPEGGVAESNDVVFDDDIDTPQAPQVPIAITSNVKVDVGKRLSIKGMGLTGLLQGTLNLRQEAFKPPLLYGDIKVVKGKYKFVGQTLTIKAGEVQFIGSPSNPNLNIEAIREIKKENVIAGVRITGTPNKPIVTLFSSPTKEQAEILSYIIKGSGFNSGEAVQSNSLALGAAVALGNQLGNNTINHVSSSTSKLIEKVGISNVQLATDDDGKVAISGNIGKDLMVKYGIGVFNPGYEMTVRYYLLSQLYLESVSGTVEQSLDIYYNFDIK